MTTIQNNLNSFVKQLLVQNMSFFPELAIIKYLPSRKSVQKEWGDNFDTNTKKLLKDLWELVNNKNGEYFDLFSKYLLENKKHEKVFSLKEFHLSLINIVDSVIENDNYSEGDFYMGHSSKEYYLSSETTQLSFTINKISDGNFNFEVKYKIILPETDFILPILVDKMLDNELVFNELLIQINTINCLSSLTSKINYYPYHADWKYGILSNRVERVYYPYLSFFIDFDIDIDSLSTDNDNDNDNDDEYIKETNLSIHEKKVYDTLISLLKNSGLNGFWFKWR